MDPVCGEVVKLGSFMVGATVGPVNELGSGDELHKVPYWDRAHLGKPMPRPSTPRSALGSRGCASVPCPPRVNLTQRAVPGC